MSASLLSGLDLQDATHYCRLCFSLQHIDTVVAAYEHSIVNQISNCLGIWLSPLDFPCAICRCCVALLTTFEAFLARSKECDLLLRKRRLEAVNHQDGQGHTGVQIKTEAVDYSDEYQTPGGIANALIPHDPAGSEPQAESHNTDSEILLEPYRVEPCPLEGDIAKERPVIKPKPKFTLKTFDRAAHKYPVKKTTFDCTVCKKQFSSRVYLNFHEKKSHSESAVATRMSFVADKKAEEFVKPISAKDFRKRMGINETKRRQKQLKDYGIRYRCHECNAKFCQLEVYESHVLNYHPKDQKEQHAA